MKKLNTCSHLPSVRPAALLLAALALLLAMSATPAMAQEPPAAPRNLTAAVHGDGSVTLSWEAPDDDSVSGYQVLRRRPSEGEKALLVYVQDTGSTATVYTDADVTAGTQHVYRVKAINAAGVGAQSNYVNVDVPDTETGDAAPLQAQTVTLVSNTGQAHDSSPNINHSAAQQFTTGSDAAGYDLDSVGYWIVTKEDDSALTVTLRASVSGTPDVPGDVVHTFTSPTLVADSLNIFTAPEGATLDPDTDYFLVMEETAGAITMRATASASEDTGGLDGFSIADSRLWCNAPCGSSSWNSVAGNVLQIEVEGSAVTLPPLVTSEAPGAPPGLIATPGDGQVTLSWTAPASTGGADITRYEYEQDGSGTWTSTGVTATSHTVTGLTNGQAYTFRVRAVNSVGPGEASAASPSVTPTSSPVEPPHGYPQPCSATPDASDTTAPSLTGAQVDGETVTLEFDEAICGGAGSALLLTHFNATVNGSAWRVRRIAYAGSTVSLTLQQAVKAGDAISIRYKPDGFLSDQIDPLDDIEKLNDLNHNLVAAFRRITADDSLDNVTPATPVEVPHGYPQPCSATPDASDTTAPSLTGAQVDGETVMLEFDEAICGGAGEQLLRTHFHATVNNLLWRIDRIRYAGSTVILTLQRAVTAGDAISIRYDPDSFLSTTQVDPLDDIEKLNDLNHNLVTAFRRSTADDSLDNATPEIPSVDPPPGDGGGGVAAEEEAAVGVSGLDAAWAVEAEQPTPRDEPVLPGPPAGVPYTYWDGNEQRTVWLQPDSPSGERGESSRGGGAAGGKAAEVVGRVEDRGRADGELVFLSESGSEMRLPGGVIVLLDPGWSAAQTAGFFTGNKIEASLVSDFEPFENGFFVDTEPGLASLTLANSFVGQPGVVLSSPNWQIELITK